MKSRQRLWQLKMIKEKRCVNCGNKLNRTGQKCIQCALIATQRKNYIKRTQRKKELNGNYVIDINGKVRKQLNSI